MYWSQISHTFLDSLGHLLQLSELTPHLCRVVPPHLWQKCQMSAWDLSSQADDQRTMMQLRGAVELALCGVQETRVEQIDKFPLYSLGELPHCASFPCKHQERDLLSPPDSYESVVNIVMHCLTFLHIFPCLTFLLLFHHPGLSSPKKVRILEIETSM